MMEIGRFSRTFNIKTYKPSGSIQLLESYFIPKNSIFINFIPRIFFFTNFMEVNIII